MPKAKFAVIAVDQAPGIAMFQAWLERNRHHLLGISKHTGSGGWVDGFELELAAKAEIAEMPRVLAGMAMKEECKRGKPTYTAD